LMSGMFVVLVFLSTVFSVYPVLERVRQKLELEAANRAFLLARQIVDRNAQYVYEKVENKVDVGFVDKEPGVQSAYLIDMDGRVMAPARKLNQSLTEVNEASFSASARKAFYDKETRERYAQVYGSIVAVAVPMKVFSSASGKNVSVALALVFFDQSLLMFDSGTEAMAYIQALILSSIVAVVIFFSLYRLTLRPLLTLNDEVDQVLKGNASQVAKKFKMEEIDPLIDVVNAALQRVSSSSGSSGTDSTQVEELVNTLKFTADRMSATGVLILSADRKILHLNAMMEEITGIRKDVALGADISAAARDAAFVAFVSDILTRAPNVGQEPAMEDFEFSGSSYKMEALSFGQNGMLKAYWLSAVRSGQ
jgi:methyl-accepting chemotaxis protein